MKKYSILIAVLVLTTALLAGCRRPGAAPTELPPTQGPTLMPTTVPTSAPTTMPTTLPTTEAPTETSDDIIDSTEAETGTGATANNNSRMIGK